MRSHSSEDLKKDLGPGESIDALQTLPSLSANDNNQLTIDDVPPWVFENERIEIIIFFFINSTEVRPNFLNAKRKTVNFLVR